MFSGLESELMPVRLAPPVVCGAAEKMADTLYATCAVLVIPFLISLKRSRQPCRQLPMSNCLLAMVELFLENVRADGTVISKKQGGYV
jgi:hypothetical protein